MTGKIWLQIVVPNIYEFTVLFVYSLDGLHIDNREKDKLLFYNWKKLEFILNCLINSKEISLN